MFEKVSTSMDFLAREKEVLAFWTAVPQSTPVDML